MQIQERARRTPKAGRGGSANKTGSAPKKKTGNGGANGGDAHDEASELDVRRLLRALQAVRDGDFSVRLASDQTGLVGKVATMLKSVA